MPTSPSTDGLISSIGPSTADRPAARRVIDCRGGIVVPGFVNAHTHMAMTMFRGLADDLDLDGFLGRLVPAEGAVLTADTVAAGTALAVAECLRAGITTALDMYFFPEAAGAVADADRVPPAQRSPVHRVPRPRPAPVPGADGVGRAAPRGDAGGPPLRVPAQHLPAVAGAAVGGRRVGRAGPAPASTSTPARRPPSWPRCGPATAARRSRCCATAACSGRAPCWPTPCTSPTPTCSSSPRAVRRWPTARRPTRSWPAGSPGSPSCSPPASRWRSAPTARRRPTTWTRGWPCGWPPTRRPRCTAPAPSRPPPCWRWRRSAAPRPSASPTAPGPSSPASGPTWSCSTPRHRRSRRATTPSRRSPTRHRGPTCGRSSPAGASPWTTASCARSTWTRRSPPFATSPRRSTPPPAAVTDPDT